MTANRQTRDIVTRVKDLNDILLVTRTTVFGDKHAFGLPVGKYQSSVRRFFLNQTIGDRQLSDDLAQDTFIKAYTHIGQFRISSSFSTWLYRIAYNVFLDYVRRNRPSDDINTVSVAYHNAEKTDTSLRLDIYDALALLGEKERVSVTLQLIDGYSIKEIARITGMTEGTVKSHLFRGKKRLAKYLKQNGYARKQ